MGNRLLLADDSITIQKVVAIIFANEEYELTVVDNGIAALEKARELRPDVMLVDALMPGKSGYEVCAELRRDPALAGTPILLLIGAFEPFDEEKARECGADASITKPFESQQLIDRVKDLLTLGQNRAAAPAPAAAAPAAVPAAAAFEPAAAEELWGDLSSFDTMAPVTPVAPEPPVAAPVAATPAAPQAAPAAPAAEPIVEVSPEDDLWGAFDLEEVTAAAPVAAAPAAAPAAASVTEAVEPEPEFEVEEFFGFEDDEDIEETGPAFDITETPAAQASAEELFSFADVEPEPVAQPDPFNFPAEEPFSFEPEVEAPAAAFTAEAFDAPVAAPAAPAPQAPVVPVQVDVVQAPAAAQAPAGAATLSEAELVAALSKVSREVIERIVWEIVPDLAEVIIKEEIRKLKAGIKG
jgi:CheY-like chemotaxis protein